MEPELLHGLEEGRDVEGDDGDDGAGARDDGLVDSDVGRAARCG